MLVCILGTLFNLANILVLTHRDMRNPVNMILTGMAVADFLNNFEYIPFTAHMNLLDTEARSIEDEVSGNRSQTMFVSREGGEDPITLVNTFHVIWLQIGMPSNRAH